MSLRQPFLCVFFFCASALLAQTPKSRLATLSPELAWQRTSPVRGATSGPVLYQIIFRSSATPGSVPKISPTFTLTNSLISEDINGIHIGALTILPSGSITLCCGQSFGSGSGGSGTVTSIGTASGSGIIANPNPIVTTGTLSVDSTVVPLLGSANSFSNTNSFTGSNGSAIVTAIQNAAGVANPGFPSPLPPVAILGQATAATNVAAGVTGTTVSPNGVGVVGANLAGTSAPNAGAGVFGATLEPAGSAVEGHAFATTGNAVGVFGQSDGAAGVGGEFVGATAVMAQGPSVFNGNVALNGNVNVSGNTVAHGGTFNGNVTINGNVSVSGTKSFRIDDPIDPANKYLVHASIESSEVLNLYSGNVTLNKSGKAIVRLPTWMQAENKDFRYQLTCIGAFAPVYIAKEITSNQFQIAGGRAGMKVSWQITAMRNDSYIQAHPMVVEEAK